MVKHSNNSSAVFDHFVGLVVKELSENNQWLNKITKIQILVVVLVMKKKIFISNLDLKLNYR